MRLFNRDMNSGGGCVMFAERNDQEFGYSEEIETDNGISSHEEHIQTGIERPIIDIKIENKKESDNELYQVFKEASINFTIEPLKLK
jgi:hypothetical protein